MSTKLTTKRLILRSPVKKDTNDIVEGMNNLKVAKHMRLIPHPYKKKNAEKWISYCSKEFRKKKPNDYPFSIELKSERKLIGGIELFHVHLFDGSAGVGYWINEKYWRQGMVSEALKKVLGFAFKDLKLNRIELTADPKNKASNIIAKKFGFKFEGKKREVLRTISEKRLCDRNIYGLLRKDWLKIKKRLKK